MKINEDQFVEIISNAIDAHVSRDPSIVLADAQWEYHNVARTVSGVLRSYGFDVPSVGPHHSDFM